MPAIGLAVGSAVAPDSRVPSLRSAPLLTPLWILAALAVTMFLRYARELCIPIALAALFSFALAPFVRLLERGHLRHGLAVTVTMVLLVGAATWGAYAAGDSLAQTIEELPQTIREARARVQQSGGSLLRRLQKASDELTRSSGATTKSPRDQTSASGSALSRLLWQGSSGAMTVIGDLTVIVFLMFFLLLSARGYRARIVSLAGARLSSRRETSEVIDEITSQIERFIVVRIVTAVLVGIATWLGLLAIGAPQPGAWGLLAGLFNSIPFFGPVIVSGGLFIVGTVGVSVAMGAKMAAVALVITTLEGWLITPPLLGRAARMHTLAVFFGLLFWSWVWGIWGTILAVPMLAVIKSVADHVDALEPVSGLLRE